MRHRIMLGMAIVIAAAGSSAQTRADQWAYGIGDDNWMYKVNVNNGNVDGKWDVRSPGGISGSANSNSLARDPGQNRLLFRSPESGSNSKLYSFDLTSNAIVAVTNGTDAALPTPTASAAFYNGAYWTVDGNNGKLYKLTLTGDVVTDIASTTAGIGFRSFGDIVIREADGRLFGSSESRLFALDIDDSGSTIEFTHLQTTAANSSYGNLQLALAPDGTLYGYQHENSVPNANDKGWYQINTDLGSDFGKRTYLGYRTDSPSFRDLADTTIPTPEPSTLAIAALGGLAMVWRARRRQAA